MSFNKLPAPFLFFMPVLLAFLCTVFVLKKHVSAPNPPGTAAKVSPSEQNKMDEMIQTRTSQNQGGKEISNEEVGEVNQQEQESETEKDPEFTGKTRIEISKTEPSLQCSDLEKLRNRSKSNGLDELIVERKTTNGVDFIFFDEKRNELFSCIGGKTKAGRLKIAYGGGELSDYMIRFASPFIGDIDNDNREDFFLNVKACHEGPCFGGAEMVRIAESGFEPVISIDLDEMAIGNKQGKYFLELQSNFWSHQYDQTLRTFHFAEFTNPGKLRIIPMREASNRLSEEFKKHMSTMEDWEKNDRASRAEDEAEAAGGSDFAARKLLFARVQAILNRAYRGEPFDKLIAELGQVEKDYGGKIPAYCNIPALLRLVSM